jgi:hypothetical protein
MTVNCFAGTSQQTTVFIARDKWVRLNGETGENIEKENPRKLEAMQFIPAIATTSPSTTDEI